MAEISCSGLLQSNETVQGDINLHVARHVQNRSAGPVGRVPCGESVRFGIDGLFEKVRFQGFAVLDEQGGQISEQHTFGGQIFVEGGLDALTVHMGYGAGEFAAAEQSGLLAKFTTAFSRDQEHKIYVQHRMLENGADLWAWLQDGAYFYVCGDASRMAKDVDDALLAIAQEHGGLDAEEAAEYIGALKKEKRYQRDVY